VRGGEGKAKRREGKEGKARRREEKGKGGREGGFAGPMSNCFLCAWYYQFW